MKTKTKIFSLLLFLTPLVTIAQTEGYYLKDEYKPNSTLNVDYRTETILEITDITGDENMLERLKSNGFSLPLKAITTQLIETKIITGAINSDSSFPVKMTLLDIHKNISVNDKEIDLPDLSTLKGVTINYTCTKDKNFDNLRIESGNVSDEIKTIFSDVTKGTKYPDKPIHIGDSFQQEMSTRIPIPGIVAVNMKIVMIYQLEKVVENKGYLHITVKMFMTPDDSSYTLNGNGNGEGTLIHDFQEDISPEVNIGMTMSFAITKDNLKINSNFGTKTFSKITY
ncbi:MAG TPA: hypothetical protein VLX91_01755 [Candidatus Acidoferrales bacterium]|nr:hypothetical protein [Candidatus Acidoferrales bacterium]